MNIRIYTVLGQVENMFEGEDPGGIAILIHPLEFNIIV